MKKSLQHIVVFAILSFACCQRIDSTTEIGTNAQQKVEFSAYIENDNTTKNSLPSDKKKPVWQSGDKINVNGSELDLKAGDGLSVAVFEGNASPYSEGWYAAYPSTSTVNSDGSIVVSFPQTQTYSSGDMNDVFMVAHNPSTSSKANLEFKNICNSLRLYLSASTSKKTVKSISVTSYGSKLYGNATISFDTDNNLIVGDCNGGYTITLDCGEGVEVASSSSSGVYFSIQLPPLNAPTNLLIDVKFYEGQKTSPEPAIKSYQAYISSVSGRNEILKNDLTLIKERYLYIDEYNINRGEAITSGNYWWAPVNCGYAKAGDVLVKGGTGCSKGFPVGKFYQWGRKDGFGRSTDESTFETITYSQFDPKNTTASDFKLYTYTKTNFYATTSGLDWYAGSPNLWASSTSENNPCPDGWTVPNDTQLNALDKNKLSANGYLGRSTGDLSETASKKYWSSKQTYWYNSYTRNVESSYSSYGANIRCVKE